MGTISLLCRVIFFVCLFCLMVGQTIWAIHVNSKFNQYNRSFYVAHAAWTDAQIHNDMAGMHKAYNTELLYLRAEHLAHADMIVSPLQWRKRWHIDYVAAATEE